MGRMYRLSKKITETQAQEILREISEIQDVNRVYFTSETTCLVVETSEENYPAVMGKAVNIFSRAGGGTEISFSGFSF